MLKDHSIILKNLVFHHKNIKTLNLAHFAVEKRLSVKVHGSVQGVSFRYYTKNKASELGIRGTVMNCPDSTVEIEAEGDEEKLKEFLEWCKEGPSSASVSDVKFQWGSSMNQFKSFKIKY
jgi:acylphosphatase